jgi:hypothetical protein
MNIIENKGLSMQPLELVGISFFSFLLGAIIVSIVNSILNRPKNEAETEKFRAETKKIYWEMDKAKDFKPVPKNKKKISSTKTVETQENIRLIGTKDVTFQVAYPVTPIVLISSDLKKSIFFSLENVSTVGFTVGMWGKQGESIENVSVNWMAYQQKQ